MLGSGMDVGGDIKLILYERKDSMASFFIKYGEQEHLQQIIDGKLRFTPSQTYIKIEEKQHNKG